MMMMKGDGDETHLFPKKGRRVGDGCLLSYTDRRERVTYFIFPANLPQGVSKIFGEAAFSVSSDVSNVSVSDSSIPDPDPAF